MLIMVAGPYTADTEEQRNINLSKLNETAYEIFEKGHIPIVGINAALPIALIDGEKKSQIIMEISLSLAERCDAILMLGKSPGANQEMQVFLNKNKPIFYTLEQIH